MEKIFYINEQYIKANSEVQDDVHVKKIKRNIWLVQQSFIKQILGSTLYNKINTDIKNNSLTGDYLTLFEEHIQPITLEYSLYKSAPFIAIALTNKGLDKKQSANSESVSLEELQFIQKQYKASGDILGELCVKHLIKSYSNGIFPEYGQDYCGGDSNIKSTSNYGGLYLGGSINNNERNYRRR